MSERVVAQLEAVAMQIRDDLRVARDLRPHHEEGGGDTQAAQLGRDARRPSRVWPIVECQSDHSATRGGRPRGQMTTAIREDGATPRQGRTLRVCARRGTGSDPVFGESLHQQERRQDADAEGKQRPMG